MKPKCCQILIRFGFLFNAQFFKETQPLFSEACFLIMCQLLYLTAIVVSYLINAVQLCFVLIKNFASGNLFFFLNFG